MTINYSFNSTLKSNIFSHIWLKYIIVGNGLFWKGVSLIVLINYIYVYYAWIIREEVITMYIRDKNISHQNINTNSGLGLFTKIRAHAMFRILKDEPLKLLFLHIQSFVCVFFSQIITIILKWTLFRVNYIIRCKYYSVHLE